MAVFKFNLQPVLNLKKQMEDNMKNELAKALNELYLQEDILKGFNNNLNKAHNEFRSCAGNIRKPFDLKTYNNYVGKLYKDIVDQNETVNKAKDNVDENRKKLVEVLQERKMLDKLRENKHHSFLKEEEVSYQKLVDEIVSFKYTAKATGEQ